MNISVVIPLYNEEESISELYTWIERVMTEHHFTFEVIFISDGSTDRSWPIIEELQQKSQGKVKGIKFRRNYGKSPALYCGFEKAEGDVVITMDADLQDSPDEIPELYRMITEEGYDLVSGYKQKRYDPLSKTLPTKLFNATARKVSGIKNLHDFNCGLKAYRSEVVKNIEVYGEMHRYIPYLRPDHALVPVHLRQEAHARLRLPRLGHVLHRLHLGLHPGCPQALLSLVGHSAATGHQLALLLHRPHDDDHRHAALPDRFLRRPHQPHIDQP